MLRVFHRHVMRLGPGRGEEELLQQSCQNFPLKSRPFTLPWPREGTSCRPWRGEGRVTKRPGVSGSPPSWPSVFGDGGGWGGRLEGVEEMAGITLNRRQESAERGGRGLRRSRDAALPVKAPEEGLETKMPKDDDAQSAWRDLGWWRGARAGGG